MCPKSDTGGMTVKVGTMVHVYSRGTGQMITGLVVDVAMNRKRVKVLTNEGSFWTTVEVLEGIERTVLPNG